jgi:uncharacterized protein YndB with AHSA1/START domain
MKLKFETTINASLGTVWAAFDHPDNLPRWQQNLESFTHLSGKRGQPGAVMELVYKEKGGKVVVQETVLERRAPTLLAGTHETSTSTTLLVNHFDRVAENTTRWSLWSNFRLRGWRRLMAIFVAGMIRQRTEADMARFRLMVETDLANAGN